ncbi:hypothetical protein CNYM01_11225 [Colletotrichum nymphaeae SA-01]|uniref:WSC domain-containing protein n=1 Tax=Colletotrichum nymphaeae SA-01 TaxID=1460502 RepID=A0A135U8W1_9PEZI|nr:hypothetical protein CNYM01_11225 [Colletotrichum nymphaeae SA-01]
MTRFPVARLLLALLATAFTNAQVFDQAQYSIPCVMQYVGCVLIPNFNTAFSRLLGDAALTPGKCQRFCSNLGSTYGSLYDGYYCRCSLVPETVAPVIYPVAESLCNRQYHCHDIVFILDDDLSDNHRHALDNVVTDFNLLRLLVIFVLLDDLNALNDLDNLNDKKHPNVPNNSMVSDVDLLFNPYVANQPVECQQYCKTNRRTITMMSKFLCICSILVPGAVTPFSSEILPNDNYCTNPCSSFPSAPCGGAIPFELGAPVYTVYQLDESQLNSTSSSSSSTISSTSTTSSLSSSSVASVSGSSTTSGTSTLSSTSSSGSPSTSPQGSSSSISSLYYSNTTSLATTSSQSATLSTSTSTTPASSVPNSGSSPLTLPVSSPSPTSVSTSVPASNPPETSSGSAPSSPTSPSSTTNSGSSTSTLPTTGPLPIDTRSTSPTLASTSSPVVSGTAFLLTVTVLNQPAPSQTLNP